MSRKSHHVVPAPRGGWNVIKGGATRATRHFDNKEDAITWGKKLSLAQGSDFVIHKEDGTIVKKDFYGPDSFPPEESDTQT